MTPRPEPGVPVVVVGGKLAGRIGVLVRYDVIRSKWLRFYPVVELDRVGRARARTVRVARVCPLVDPDPPDAAGRQHALYLEVTWPQRNRLKAMV